MLITICLLVPGTRGKLSLLLYVNFILTTGFPSPTTILPFPTTFLPFPLLPSPILFPFPPRLGGSTGWSCRSYHCIRNKQRYDQNGGDLWRRGCTSYGDTTSCYPPHGDSTSCYLQPSTSALQLHTYHD